MNKTIFQIDYRLSIIIVSLIGIIIGFISNGYMVNGFVPLLFYIIKITILCGLYLVFYLIENKNKEFKCKVKYMMGYLVLFNSFNLICVIFSLAHILDGLFMTLTSIISLYIIISFVLEILVLYFNNEIVEKIVNANKKIGLAVANPIVNFFDSKITND